MPCDKFTEVWKAYGEIHYSSGDCAKHNHDFKCKEFKKKWFAPKKEENYCNYCKHYFLGD